VDFDRAVAELDTLVQTLESEGDERALHLLGLVDAIHRPALELLLRGDAEHPLAQAVLAMYDLAAVDPLVEAEAALDAVRPYIQSHGGDVHVLSVEHGVVHLRLSGACNGCAGSAMTLRRGVETALREQMSGFVAMEVHEPAPVLLQIEDLRRPVFVDVGGAAEMSDGDVRTVEADGVAVLLARVEGEIYAVRNACAVGDMPLEGGRLTGSVLVCPWHNCAYDIRTGARVDGEDGRLAVGPVAVRDGWVNVAVNVA
jgi:Fe-S cluster biogenesis protein NfuA/nitrite reductase/ring-hydroxylating ferredoxin subunit